MTWIPGREQLSQPDKKFRFVYGFIRDQVFSNQVELALRSSLAPF